MLFEIYNIVKGGKYKYCRTIPLHPRSNPRGYYPLHIVRCENKAGRLMLAHEIVHHIDEDKTNDSSDNLEFKCRRKHTSDHVRERHKLSRCNASNTQDAALGRNAASLVTPS